jgi:hypothetical protein
MAAYTATPEQESILAGLFQPPSNSLLNRSASSPPFRSEHFPWLDLVYRLSRLQFHAARTGELL